MSSAYTPTYPHQPLGGLLKGKRALVTGVANDRSIAWAIAEAFHAEGAELAFTYPGEAMGKRVIPLVEQLAPAAILDCDVASDASIAEAFALLKKKWETFDILIHSIAYTPREAISGRFTEVTSREAFRISLDVSAYSLIALTRAARPFMPSGGSVACLSYIGGEKVVPNYNVAGVAKAALESSMRYLAEDLGPDNIRVNAISAGPLKTLAAAGIRGMRTMLGENAEKTPLQRNIGHEDVARAALYLCSDLAKNVTGEVLHVDSGQNIMGVVSMR